MPRKLFLKNITIPSPCSADWNSMKGNDQVRFCEHCDLSVHNLSQMTRHQAERLVVSFKWTSLRSVCSRCGWKASVSGSWTETTSHQPSRLTHRSRSIHCDIECDQRSGPQLPRILQNWRSGYPGVADYFAADFSIRLRFQPGGYGNGPERRSHIRCDGRAFAAISRSWLSTYHPTPKRTIQNR